VHETSTKLLRYLPILEVDLHNDIHTAKKRNLGVLRKLLWDWLLCKAIKDNGYLHPNRKDQAPERWSRGLLRERGRFQPWSPHGRRCNCTRKFEVVEGLVVWPLLAVFNQSDGFGVDLIPRWYSVFNSVKQEHWSGVWLMLFDGSCKVILLLKNTSKRKRTRVIAVNLTVTTQRSVLLKKEKDSVHTNS